MPQPILNSRCHSVSRKWRVFIAVPTSTCRNMRSIQARALNTLTHKPTKAMFLSIVCHSYEEEKLENGETRVVMKLPAALAPVKCAVFPLVKKDGLPEKAREIVDELKFHFNTHYEEKDTIGKRYRRHDAIGTPFCVTVDHDTLNDNCVTLRYRDTMEQKRVPISELRALIEDQVSITSLLKKL